MSSNHAPVFLPVKSEAYVSLRGGSLSAGRESDRLVGVANAKLFPELAEISSAEERHFVCSMQLQHLDTSDPEYIKLFPCRIAGEMPSPRTDRRAFFVYTMMTALMERFHLMSELSDLEATIACARELCTLDVHFPIQQTTSLVNLAGYLSTKFHLTAEVSILKEVIACYEKAYQVECKSTNENSPVTRCGVLRLLGDHCLSYGQTYNDDLYVTAAIEHYKEAVKVTMDKHLDHLKGRALQVLGDALLYRMRATGSIQDVDSAIAYLSEVKEMYTNTNPLLLGVVQGFLGTCFFQKFQFERAQVHIDAAVEMLTASILASDTNSFHVEYISAICNLATAHAQRFTYYGDISDLDSAAKKWKQLLGLDQTFRPRAQVLVDLGGIYHTWFKTSDHDAHHREALAHFSEATLLSGAPSPLFLRFLIEVAQLLTARFQKSRHTSDIEVAVDYLERALKFLPLGGERNDASKYLEQAYALQLTTAVLAEEVDPDILIFDDFALGSSFLPNEHQGWHSFKQYLDTRDRTYLDQAISLLSADCSSCDLSTDFKVQYLTFLGLALCARARRGSLDDFAKALDHLKEATHLCSVDHPQRLATITAYANTWQHQIKAEMEYYNGLAMTIKPLAVPDEFLPELKDGFSGVATEVFNKYDVEHKARRTQYLHEITNMYEEAISSPNITWSLCFAAYLGLQSLAIEHCHTSAHKSFTQCLDLLSFVVLAQKGGQVCPKVLDIGSAMLKVSSDAAHAAIQEGDFATAVEYLEFGKALSGLDVITVEPLVSQVALFNGDLAQKLAGMIGSDLMPALSTWHGLLGSIRKYQQLQDFLKPKRYTELQHIALSHTPTVILNLGPMGAYALIVLSQGGPILVQLSKVNLEMIVSLESKVKGIIGNNTPLLVQPTPVLIGSGVLDELWIHIVGPIIENFESYLGLPNTSQPQKLCWYTYPILQGLPLHTAGLYKGKGRKLSLHYQSLYISSLTSLATLEL